MKKLLYSLAGLTGFFFSFAISFGGEIQEQAIVPSGAQDADTWYRYIMEKLTHEHGLAAAVAGLFVSWGLTQLIKFSFPKEWTPFKIVWRTRLCAFITGFIATMMLWPVTYDLAQLNMQQTYSMIVIGMAVSTIVGTASPMLWKLAMHYGYKFGFFKEEKWSAVTRASQTENKS